MMSSTDPRLLALQAGAVAAENDILIAMVSVSIAELSVRYGSETVENLLTEMLTGDEYHDLTALARAEREAVIDDVQMQSYDIVAGAETILDES
jgi:hypothetical protein